MFLHSSSSLTVARMEVTLGAHVYYHYDHNKYPQALFFKITSSLLKFANDTNLEIKLGTHVCNIVSMTTITTNSLRHFSLKLLLHSSNLLMSAHMEMKHGMRIISVTTTGIFLYYNFIGACPLPQSNT